MFYKKRILICASILSFIFAAAYLYYGHFVAQPNDIAWYIIPAAFTIAGLIYAAFTIFSNIYFRVKEKRRGIIRIALIGDYEQIAAEGNSVQIDLDGKNLVICCVDEDGIAGKDFFAKAKVGSKITLSDWENIDGKYMPICVKTEYVDGKKIKENTRYALYGGEFIEVAELVPVANDGDVVG